MPFLRFLGRENLAWYLLLSLYALDAFGYAQDSQDGPNALGLGGRELDFTKILPASIKRMFFGPMLLPIRD